QGGVVALVGVPQIGGDEQVLASHAGGGDRPAHARFVLVSGGGVDQPVADPQCFRARGLRFVVGHLPDAESKLRDEVAVVQLHGGNGRISHGSHGSNQGHLRTSENLG